MTQETKPNKEVQTPAREVKASQGEMGVSQEEKKQEIRKLGFSEEKTVDYLANKFTIETIRNKIQSLQSTGFTNPVSLIEKFPPIASYKIKRVIQDLKSVGFSDPVSLIEKHPRIASFKIKNVIRDFKSVGFSNPVSLIEKFPPIADLNINRVIQDLKSVGFSDPVSLIKTSPSITGLDINRIKRRLELIRRLNKTFQLELDPINIIKQFPTYLNYDIKRIFFYLRIASFYGVDHEFYRNRLITKNPFIVFNILYNLYSRDRILDEDEFETQIKRINKLSKETKREIQDETENNLPQIIENLKQQQDDENAKFLLKLASYLEVLLEKKKKKRK